ncbi:MAG: metallophosphoesterase family protein [Verrucomicrobia bacterium]|nr:metallophosphoesterase family protein [Verrucomicrobiota bacterium]MCH8512956.1 metallophosphatase family protein [Kiritimatiellia bacterium]
MIIGLLSDTHGNVRRTETALSLLKNAGAQHILHCGDIGSEEIINLLFETRETGTPVTLVHGNVDQWDPGLHLYAKQLGLSLPRIAKGTFDTFSYGMTHGHDPQAINELLEENLDFIFTGHTHVPCDETHGSTRMINPGAVHRAQTPMVSVLETRTGALKRLPL